MSTAAAALRRDIPFLRSERLLFTLHFKRILIPLIAFCAILYFPTLIVARTIQHTRNVPAQQIDNALNVLCAVLAFLIALPIGTAAFSGQFKEQHILFFHALPVSRTRQWVVLVAASLSALAATVFLLWVAAPSALADLQSTGLSVLFGLMLLTFAAGACFALAFARPVEVYLGAYALTWFLLAGALWSVAAPSLIYSAPRHATPGWAFNTYLGNSPTEIPVAILPIIAALFFVLFLAASHYFYVRGEMTLTRNRIRNPLLVVAIGLAIDFLLVPAMVHGLSMQKPFYKGDSQLSQDCRYLAVHYARENRPWLSKVRVIDLSNGKTMSTIETPGLTHFRFMGNTLAIVERDMSVHRRLPFLFAPRDRLELRDTGGHLVKRTMLEDEIVVGLQQAGKANVALAVIRGDRGRIMAWDPSGSIRELARAEGIDSLRLGMHTAYAKGLTNRSHVWRTGESAEELPWSGAAKDESPSIVHGVAYASPDLAIRAIEHNMPVPRKSGEAPQYGISSGAVTEISHVFAVVGDSSTRKAALWVEHDSRWTRIADKLTIAPGEQILPMPAAYGWRVDDLSIGRSRGLAAFVTRSGNKCTLHLYDAHTDRTYDLATVDDPRNEMHPGVLALDQQTTEVMLLKVPGGNWVGFLPRIEEYAYREGEIQQVPKARGYLLALFPDGTQLREINWWTMSVVPPHGPARMIRF